MRRIARWVWRRRWIVVILIGLGAVAVNGVAYMHAYRMTHLVDATHARTTPPEGLSVWQKGKILLTGVRFPRPTNHVTPADVGLKFETHIFNAGETPLEAWVIRVIPSSTSSSSSASASASAGPSRKLVILFHSYGAAKSSLLPAAKEFLQLGCDVMLVDFRGSGGSGGSVTTIGFREADDVAAAVEYARMMLGVDQPILYGASMGAAAILRAIRVHELSPRAIVIESPFDRLLSAVENRFDAMGVPSFPFARLLVFWGGIQHGYWGFAHNPADDASYVTCPTLVLHGKLDRRATLAQAKEVFRRLSANQTTFKVFENAGHVALLSEEPELWRQMVGEFVRRHH